MMKKNNLFLNFSDFFIVRTPLLPLKTIQNISRDEIIKIYSMPEMQEAIYIASPGLHAGLMIWLSDLSVVNKKNNKILLSLSKYLLRAAYRCTPFGLFAGISLGKWNEAAEGILTESKEHIRHNRLDMDYLSSLIQEFEKVPQIRKSLTYYPNNTLYKNNNKLRYIEYRVTNTHRQHYLVSVDLSTYLIKLLEVAKNGASTFVLAKSLESKEINFQESMEFVNEVINSQILMSDLEVRITGEEALPLLIRSIEKCGEEHIASKLKEISNLLNNLNNYSFKNNIYRYNEIINNVKSIGVEYDPRKLFQVDLFKPNLKLSLPKSMQQDISNAVEILSSGNHILKSTPLDKFIEAFKARYENQEIPLLTLMDVEMGLGYPLNEKVYGEHLSLLDGLKLGEDNKENLAIEMTPWRQFILNKYYSLIKEGGEILFLDEESVNPFLKAGDRDLPNSMFAITEILAPSPKNASGTYKACILAVGVGSVANIVGRFCHLDQLMSESVKKLISQEHNNQNSIFAEIVHVDQSRVANISTRPMLREHEIPILSRPNALSEKTIYLSDLQVSVQDKRIVLRSKTLNKEIVPRLSSSHNYSKSSLPVYRFLCDLQNQGTSQSLIWDWGVVRDSKYLPRVEYKSVILSKAQWVLSRGEVLGIASDDDETLLEKAVLLQNKYRIPNWVILVDDDNKLPLNLKNIICLKVLLSEIKNRDKILITECLFDEESLWINNSEGYYTNEVIVPISNLNYEAPKIVFNVESKQNIERSFVLGSEWFYVKLYCGNATSDDILINVIKPLTKELLHSNTIDQWFFVRYNDPENHLRIRFHGKGNFYSVLIKKLQKYLFHYSNSGLLSDFKTEAYQRELERYYNIIIIPSEKLFYYDSLIIVNILAILEGEGNEELRWLLTIKSVDMMLTDFGLDIIAKRSLLNALRTQYKIEFNANNLDAEKSLAVKYRSNKSAIYKILMEQTSEDELTNNSFQELYRRSNLWKETISDITVAAAGASEILPQLLQSYLHMSINRILRSKQRIQEFVIFDFLYQYYSSEIARKK